MRRPLHSARLPRVYAPQLRPRRFGVMSVGREAARFAVSRAAPPRRRGRTPRHRAMAIGGRRNDQKARDRDSLHRALSILASGVERVRQALSLVTTASTSKSAWCSSRASATPWPAVSAVSDGAHRRSRCRAGRARSRRWAPRAGYVVDSGRARAECGVNPPGRSTSSSRTSERARPEVHPPARVAPAIRGLGRAARRAARRLPVAVVAYSRRGRVA